eukprot:scaffold7816_cov113-Isochrysis_galbana.AAC.3
MFDRATTASFAALRLRAARHTTHVFRLTTQITRGVRIWASNKQLAQTTGRRRDVAQLRAGDVCSGASEVDMYDYDIRCAQRAMCNV